MSEKTKIVVIGIIGFLAILLVGNIITMEWFPSVKISLIHHETASGVVRIPPSQTVTFFVRDDDFTNSEAGVVMIHNYTTNTFEISPRRQEPLIGQRNLTMRSNGIAIGRSAVASNDNELVITVTDGTKLRRKLPSGKTVNFR